MFFTKLAELIGEHYTVQIVAKVKSGKLTLTFIPQIDSKNTEVTSKLVPLTITETPDEIDRQIIPIITQAMSKTSTLAEALAAYEKGIDSAKKALEKKETKEEKKDPKQDLKKVPGTEKLKEAKPEIPKEDWEDTDTSGIAEEIAQNEENPFDEAPEEEVVADEPEKEEKEPELPTAVKLSDLDDEPETKEEPVKEEPKMGNPKQAEDDW